MSESGMTRQQAWIKLMHMFQENLNPNLTYEQAQAVMDKIEPLANLIKPAKPDPETGLVLCGCGGVLELHTRPLSFAKHYNNTTDRDIEYQHHVFCRKCHWSTMDYLSKELAIKYANRAMGYREDGEQ